LEEELKVIDETTLGITEKSKEESKVEIDENNPNKITYIDAYKRTDVAITKSPNKIIATPINL